MKEQKEKNKDKNNENPKLIDKEKNIKEIKIDCKIPKNEKDVEGLEYFAE